MSSFCFRDWVRKALKSIRSDTEATRVAVGMINARLDMILEELTKMAANFDKLNADLNTLVAGYQSVVAENAILKGQLATADADKQQAVADAIAADDAVDQAAVDAADLVVENVLNPAPPVEPTP